MVKEHMMPGGVCRMSDEVLVAVSNTELIEMSREVSGFEQIHQWGWINKWSDRFHDILEFRDRSHIHKLQRSQCGWLSYAKGISLHAGI